MDANELIFQKQKYLWRFQKVSWPMYARTKTETKNKMRK